jgi:hypothetical protein
MAKSLKDTLKLVPKVELKKIEKNIEETEKVVALIHEEITTAEPAPSIVEEKIVVKEVIVETATPNATEITKRVTLDIPLSLHAEIKMKTFRQGSTIKDYLLELAKKDLGLKG